jgi:hypothetical protein
MRLLNMGGKPFRIKSKRLLKDFSARTTKHIPYLEQIGENQDLKRNENIAHPHILKALPSIGLNEKQTRLNFLVGPYLGALPWYDLYL